MLFLGVSQGDLLGFRLGEPKPEPAVLDVHLHGSRMDC